MKHARIIGAALLGFVGAIFAAGPADGETPAPPAPQGGATVKEVFERGEKAVAKGDWATWFDCIHPNLRNVFLWRIAAGVQFGGEDDGSKRKLKDLEALLDRDGIPKTYDKDFYMPHTLSELDEALAPSYADLKDMRASFAAVVAWVETNTEMMKDAKAGAGGRLEELVESGDEAKAQHVKADGKREPLKFWRFDGRWYLVVEDERATSASPPKKPAAVPAECAGIQSAFARTQTAVAKRDWAAWHDLLPPDRRKVLLFRLVESGLMAGEESRAKGKEFEALLEREKLPKTFDAGLDTEKDYDKLDKSLETLLSGAKDLRGSFAKVGDWVETNTEFTAGFSFQWSGRLEQIRTKGDKAEATLVKASGKTTPLKFHKIADQWYLDFDAN